MNTNIKYVILEDRIPYDWDDYDLWGCVLYNIENNSIITERYGHGQDLNVRNISCSLNESIENKIVSIDKIIDALVDSLHFGFPDIENYSTKFSYDNPLSIPCKVIRGRKFKGDGYLICGIKKQSYNPYRYYSRYYGPKNEEYKVCPVIYDPKTNTFNVVNSFNYICFDENFKDSIISNIRNCIDNTIKEINSLAHIFAYKMSYSACDSRNEKYEINKYETSPLTKLTVNDIVLNAVEKYKEEQNKKKAMFENTFKENKMKQLIEWVKNNTDKEGDDIVKLAEHIYNKKYKQF